MSADLDVDSPEVSRPVRKQIGGYMVVYFANPFGGNMDIFRRLLDNELYSLDDRDSDDFGDLGIGFLSLRRFKIAG